MLVLVFGVFWSSPHPSPAYECVFLSGIGSSSLQGWQAQNWLVPPAHSAQLRPISQSTTADLSPLPSPNSLSTSQPVDGFLCNLLPTRYYSQRPGVSVHLLPLCTARMFPAVRTTSACSPKDCSSPSAAPPRWLFGLHPGSFEYSLWPQPRSSSVNCWLFFVVNKSASWELCDWVRLFASKTHHNNSIL